MSVQQTIEQAHKEGKLELKKWAEIMLKRIRMNFEVQHIWPEGIGYKGPYKDYWIVNMARKGKYKSTGEAFTEQNLRAKVINGAGGNTVAVDFFFRRYLLFVDWGVGAGQKISEVPDVGTPNMKKRYNKWEQAGDRQRRPVVMGAIRGGRFFMAKILEDYWKTRAETTILYGFGTLDENGDYQPIPGSI